MPGIQKNLTWYANKTNLLISKRKNTKSTDLLSESEMEYFSRELEPIKNTVEGLLQLRNLWTEIENSIYCFNRRLDKAGERIRIIIKRIIKGGITKSWQRGKIE